MFFYAGVVGPRRLERRTDPWSPFGVYIPFPGQTHLVAYFKTDYPGLGFDRALVNSLAEFSLSVDFDFYYLYSDIREDS